MLLDQFSYTSQKFLKFNKYLTASWWPISEKESPFTPSITSPKVLKKILFQVSPKWVVKGQKCLKKISSGNPYQWKSHSLRPVSYHLKFEKTRFSSRLSYKSTTVRKLKEVAFIAGKSENQADRKKFIRFSFDNSIANISFYALSCLKFNFGYYFTFEIVF